MYVCSFGLCLPIRIRNVPFPQKQAEMDKKKKEAAAARELKAAKKAAEKAEAEAARAESAAVCVQPVLSALCIFKVKNDISFPGLHQCTSSHRSWTRPNRRETEYLLSRPLTISSSRVRLHLRREISPQRRNLRINLTNESRCFCASYTSHYLWSRLRPASATPAYEVFYIVSLCLCILPTY